VPESFGKERRDAFQRIPLCRLQPPLRQPVPQLRIQQQLFEPVRHAAHVAGLHDEGVTPVGRELRDGADLRCHHGTRASHRFERRQTEALVAARVQEHRRRRIQTPQIGIAWMEIESDPRGQTLRTDGPAHPDLNIRESFPKKG
jgi:hypothetical protein